VVPALLSTSVVLIKPLHSSLNAVL